MPVSVRPRYRQTLFAGFGLVLLVIGMLVLTGSLERYDLSALDLQFRALAGAAHSAPMPDVVVVGIDEASLKEFAVPVATLHRQLGKFFEAMAVAGVRAVGVDVVLPETSYDAIQPGLDAALARGILALRHVAPLVLGVSARADGTLRELNPLFANLAGPDGVASVFVLKDVDGFVRRFDERIGERGQDVPSLVGTIARRLGVTVAPGVVPLFRTGQVQVIALREVLDAQQAGDIDGLRKRFSGKVVLLGPTLPFEDRHRVTLPLATSDSGGTTHGVFVHAAHLQSLLQGNLLHQAPTAVAWAGLFLLSLGWWLSPTKTVWIAASIVLFGLWATSMQLLMRGWVLPVATWSVALLGGLGSRTALAAWQSAAERRRLRRAFDGFVSPGVLKEILNGNLHPKLAGERRDICVLFSDIRGFTTLSESLAPEVVTDLLNRYFERMARCIHEHNGTLDKFIGDGIMAFFGAPQYSAAPCHDAFAAARQMVEQLTAFNREQEQRNGPVLAIGIGLHYGPAFIGYIGAKDRHEYSAIGDTVNSAARLEGLTKDSGYPILMSATVQSQLTEVAGTIGLGERAVKGRAAIEVFGWKEG